MRLLLLSGLVACGLLFSGHRVAAGIGPAPEQLQSSIKKGTAFLKSTQAEDGTWTSPTSLGITGLVTYSLLVSDVPATDPVVQKGLKLIEANIQPDGGIYNPKSNHKNYETSISVMALTSANADGHYNDKIEKAVAFLKEIQWDEGEIGDRGHASFGGAGYGSHSRPDLSNTAFFIEALQAAGISSHDEAMQDALVFVSRCQNLPSKDNTTPFAEKVKDGGFYYTPAAGGSSQAGNTPDGGLRSYASMTYAGLKSMIYAGVNADDPRVKAAQEWIKKFYTLQENPGMGQQGLFYYYQTFAKTLDVLGSDEFVDTNSVSHDWRKELAERLFSLQQANGSWTNPAERWYEGDPNLATAYALIALSRCDAPAGK
ncbi:prenyltransferase/squalene oxidase repeat-containing protein [Planctomicrobium piriforme]|uniref:Squalene-hopene/tetraprenyl-beta-curcumene cyclase n=1 Tax=Planctomicrobium piriforme TaxID=1576369 RepID=A0A1I3B2P4_9PLAN|nr:prenyltransferase/squalene oxidase repeat-containing protein [Planctomicrobium piriforme]SFH56574.1 squalene-hopene/tetraprenyl-beta-curcumene cyclase [Planctomicrobium piriforme]